MHGFGGHIGFAIVGGEDEDGGDRLSIAPGDAAHFGVDGGDLAASGSVQVILCADGIPSLMRPAVERDEDRLQRPAGMPCIDVTVTPDDGMCPIAGGMCRSMVNPGMT